ncbi:MAG: hypothetical protein M1839_008183 [Geoglossum umbratile]|nr:MAG: hypothetical protein M1839_008183 [Geoglossum umbratile]
MSSFTEIPILDLSLARSPDTKPQFLESLRHALLEVGFLYIKNTGIEDELVKDAIEQGKAFFDLPMEAKLEIEMKNGAPSLPGLQQTGKRNVIGTFYASCESIHQLSIFSNISRTKFATDWREQIDLSTNHPLRTPDQPLYWNLLAPNQWPDFNLLPHFRPVYEKYMIQMGEVSMFFMCLVAEAIGLPPDAFDRFFDTSQQHKLKIIKYPDLAELGTAAEGKTEAQGVGPHKDSMLTSYLLQATEHRGLQAQNTAGQWIDCPPIAGTLVVAIGQGLEALTQGVCASTTHRVLSPAPGTGPRFSIPFFQGVSYDATFESMAVPEEVIALKAHLTDQNGGGKDDVEFTFTKGKYKHLGEATLMNRIKSHPDVGKRWFPDLLKQLQSQQAQEESALHNTAHGDPTP